MIQALFNFIINLFFWILGIIGSIVIYPIQAIIVTIFPSMGTFISLILTFFREQIFPIITLIKIIFLNITGITEELWTIFIGFIVARWMIAPAIRSIKYLINLWKIYKGTI